MDLVIRKSSQILSNMHDNLLFRMKPTRIRMCHSLVMNYGLYKKMEIFVSSIGFVVACSGGDGIDSERNLPPNEK